MTWHNMAHRTCVLSKRGCMHTLTHMHMPTRPGTLTHMSARVRAHTHTHKYVIFIAFPRQQWFPNAPQCYVIRTLSFLFWGTNDLYIVSSLYHILSFPQVENKLRRMRILFLLSSFHVDYFSLSETRCTCNCPRGVFCKPLQLEDLKRVIRRLHLKCLYINPRKHTR